MRHLLEVSEVQALIRRGDMLLLAGDEALLRQLPPGRWIAGTIPYFMTEDGGVCDRTRIFVERPGPSLEYAGVRRYGEGDIARVFVDMPHVVLTDLVKKHDGGGIPLMKDAVAA